MTINFFQENIEFILPQEEMVRPWLNSLALQEDFHIVALNYIFCNDKFLHEINTEYLNHDTFTDIISFDNSDHENTIEGDIFISIERVEENAKNLEVDFTRELLRVISHGLFHLCGYNDQLEEEIKVMRQKEDAAVSGYYLLKS